MKTKSRFKERRFTLLEDVRFIYTCSMDVYRDIMENMLTTLWEAQQNRNAYFHMLYYANPKDYERIAYIGATPPMYMSYTNHCIHMINFNTLNT